MGLYVPTLKLFPSFGDPETVIYQILDVRKFISRRFMVDVVFELTTYDPSVVDDAICEGMSPLGERLTNNLPKLILRSTKYLYRSLATALDLAPFVL